MTTRSKLELVGSPFPYAPPPSLAAPPAPLFPALAVTALCTLVAAAVAWASHALVGNLANDLDRTALGQATQSYERLVEQQKRALMSVATVLAEDTRVRATVMTPQFDKATVTDVLDDLRKTAGSSMLAVLDTAGRVRAVSGPQALESIDLGSAPAVKSALAGTSTDVWTVAGQVSAVGIAPVRSGGDTAALFLIAFEIGEPVLAGIERALGVSSAVLVGDKLVVASAKDPALEAAARAATDLGDDAPQAVDAGGRRYTARITRTSNSAAAAKIVWLVAHDQNPARTILLRALNWMPPLLVAMTGVLVVLGVRRHRRREARA